MKILSERCAHVSPPPKDSAGDSIQLNWLMERFGSSISIELIYETFNHLVKEFQKNPGKSKDLRFTLLCEELDGKD